MPLFIIIHDQSVRNALAMVPIIAFYLAITGRGSLDVGFAKKQGGGATDSTSRFAPCALMRAEQLL